ncbi:alpha/beta fold hydrolase [Cryptosporangium minutisporangium]|uniref:alpha/beta fold hydrolase n=1 Tax=Cryptosporangium minutisporangium TaxID=113569 RepID=UPI0031EDF753
MARITVPNGELFLDERGQGTPVVLLHGGLLDHRMWDATVERLAAAHRVIRYDARSHGRSTSAAGDYSPAEDLRAVLGAAAPEGAAVVGLSLGARTAIDFALRWPDLVERLVLVSPGASGMEFADPFIVDLQAQQVEAVQRADADGFVESFLRMWVDGPQRRPDETDPGVRAACRRMAMTVATDHYTAHGALLEDRAVDRLAELRPPLLVVTGALDSTDILRLSDAIIDAVPGAAAVRIPTAAHTVPLDTPDAFHAAVVPFLAAREPQGQR